ncbi:unnamed protein product [Lepeophtheirus salmonis]|uniref:(salmon louse) hypothetical protein n=1 Tax=Lepeophtheirus salmonis TaxID=72036 RepID=A0A7R8H8B7_LEPSM|nr:unnamed protein product [Lepeophtheirus salmonis]CAF2920081.1 unnamed protein product [Lepeophtheirus salmonis]
MSWLVSRSRGVIRSWLVRRRLRFVLGVDRDQVLVGQLCTTPKSDNFISESDIIFNERDQRYAVIQIILSPDSSYGNRTLQMQIRTIQHLSAQLRVMKTKYLETFKVFCVISSEDHIIPPQVFKIGLGINTKVYLNVLRSMVISWNNQLVAGKTLHRPSSPNSPKPHFRRSATTCKVLCLEDACPNKLIQMVHSSESKIFSFERMTADFRALDVSYEVQKSFANKFFTNKSLIKIYTKNKKEAEKVVRNIIKISVKIGMLERSEKFNTDEQAKLTRIRLNLRTIMMTIISFYQVDHTYDRNFIITHLSELKNQLQNLVKPYLTDKSLGRIDNIIEFFSEPDFLDSLYSPNKRNSETVTQMGVIVDNLNKCIEIGVL